MPPHSAGVNPCFKGMSKGTHSIPTMPQGLPSREMLDGMASAKDVHTALRDALKVSVRWQQMARSRKGSVSCPASEQTSSILGSPWAGVAGKGHLEGVLGPTTVLWVASLLAGVLNAVQTLTAGCIHHSFTSLKPSFPHPSPFCSLLWSLAGPARPSSLVACCCHCSLEALTVAHSWHVALQ